MLALITLAIYSFYSKLSILSDGVHGNPYGHVESDGQSQFLLRIGGLWMQTLGLLPECVHLKERLFASVNAQ